MTSVKLDYVCGPEIGLGQLVVPVLCTQVMGKSPRVPPSLNYLPCPLAGWVSWCAADAQVYFRPASIPVAV